MNWHTENWRRREHGHIKKLAAQAGAYAYRGPHWRTTDIDHLARAWMQESLLLAPHKDNPVVQGLVLRYFAYGWRNAERQETLAKVLSQMGQE